MEFGVQARDDREDLQRCEAEFLWQRGPMVGFQTRNTWRCENEVAHWASMARRPVLQKLPEAKLQQLLQQVDRAHMSRGLRNELKVAPRQGQHNHTTGLLATVEQREEICLQNMHTQESACEKDGQKAFQLAIE